MDLSVNEPDEIEHSDRILIVKLIRETWPPKENEIVTLEEDLEKIFGYKPEEKHIFVKNNRQICGFAKIFFREIKIGEKLIRNMALACVCVKKDLRKGGIGKTIVKKAFEAVDNKEFDCSLFQTAVPEFYEKIGARKIMNKCINSYKNNENPWWDPNVIIYPGNFKIGEAVIDLMGDGY
jgi:predicted GNAT family N-acyltransferase